MSDNAMQVVDWEKEFAVATATALKTEVADSNYISFKGGQITWNNNVAPNNEIKAVIVGSMFENAYYPYRYDPANPRSPTCWALSISGENMAPNPDLVDEAQHAKCDGCPMNEWESDPNGSKGKACKNIRRIAIQIPGGPDVLLARIPVTSVENWKAYVNQIGNVVRRPPWGVLTKIYTKPDAKSQFKVYFEFVSKLEPEELNQIYPIAKRLEAEEGTELSKPYSKNTDEPESEPKPQTKKKY